MYIKRLGEDCRIGGLLLECRLLVLERVYGIKIGYVSIIYYGYHFVILYWKLDCSSLFPNTTDRENDGIITSLFLLGLTIPAEIVTSIDDLAMLPITPFSVTLNFDFIHF